MTDPKKEAPKSGYNRFLLLVAGLGGLLYGVDVGIIAGALPYLEASQSGVIAAAYGAGLPVVADQSKPVLIAEGGRQRSDSVRAGLSARVRASSKQE